MTRRLRVLSPAESYQKTLKVVLAALSLGAQHSESRARNRSWSAQCQHNVSEWSTMSNVGGVIFQ